MLLDMHWIDQTRRIRPAPARPTERRVRRQRSRSGFLQPDLACFAPLVGRWSAEVDMHAGGLVDQDLRMRGSSRIRVAAAGHQLAIESSWQGWMGACFEHGVVTSSPVTGAFQLFLTDTFEPGCRRLDGQQVSRDTVVFEGRTSLGGVSGLLRRTMRLSAERPSWTVSFWSDQDAGRLITGRWRRHVEVRPR